MNPQDSPYSLAGRQVLVCGATGGIGRACALAAARLGAGLVLAGRRADALEAVAAECREARSGAESGAGVRTWSGDLTDEGARVRLVAEVPELDGLVVASGITVVKPLRASTPADWQRVVETNLGSVVMLTHGLLRGRRFRPGGSLVYVASIAARLGSPAHTLYSASKGGLVAFARSLALEVAASRIRVNTISPGLVRTAMADQMSAGLTADQLARYEQEYPLGLGEPGDVASLAAFLLSPAARWVTGQDWAVDGGVSIR